MNPDNHPDNAGYRQSDLDALLRNPPPVAVCHRTCGHVLAVPHSREQARRFIDTAPPAIRHQLRVRVSRNPDDCIAWLRGTRCALCTTDGRITASAAT